MKQEKRCKWSTIIKRIVDPDTVVNVIFEMGNLITERGDSFVIRKTGEMIEVPNSGERLYAIVIDRVKFQSGILVFVNIYQGIEKN